MQRLLALLLCCLALTGASRFAAAEEDHVTGEQAIQIAREAVADKLGLADAELDAYIWQVSSGPLEGHSGEIWTVDVGIPYANEIYYLYHVSIEPKSGGILLADIEPDALDGVKRMLASMEAFEKLTAEKGPWYTWTMEERVIFEKEYGGGGYRMPGEGDLTEARAVELARLALTDVGGLEKSVAEDLKVSAVLCAVENEADYWMICLYDPAIPSGDNNILTHIVYLSNPDGEVLDVSIDDGHSNG